MARTQANRKPNTPITKRERDVIASQYVSGVSIVAIAEKLGRSRQGIYNAIAEFPDSFTEARKEILGPKSYTEALPKRTTREDWDIPTSETVKELLDKGFTQRGISKHLNVPIYYITEIIHNELPEYVRPRIASDRRTARDKAIRKDYYDNGMSISELAAKYNRSECTIFNSLYRKV